MGHLSRCGRCEANFQVINRQLRRLWRRLVGSTLSSTMCVVLSLVRVKRPRACLQELVLIRSFLYTFYGMLFAFAGLSSGFCDLSHGQYEDVDEDVRSHELDQRSRDLSRLQGTSLAITQSFLVPNKRLIRVSLTQAAVPHLLRSASAGRNPHILTFAPPLKGNLTPEAFGIATGYAMAKFGMSLATLGFAGELAGKVGVNGKSTCVLGPFERPGADFV